MGLRAFPLSQRSFLFYIFLTKDWKAVSRCTDTETPNQGSTSYTSRKSRLKSSVTLTRARLVDSPFSPGTSWCRTKRLKWIYTPCTIPVPTSPYDYFSRQELKSKWSSRNCRHMQGIWLSGLTHTTGLQSHTEIPNLVRTCLSGSLVQISMITICRAQVDLSQTASITRGNVTIRNIIILYSTLTVLTHRRGTLVGKASPWLAGWIIVPL